jgi:hypothetical protein
VLLFRRFVNNHKILYEDACADEEYNMEKKDGIIEEDRMGQIWTEDYGST